MTSSVLLARLIGPLLVAVGIGVMVDRSFYRAMFDEFLNNKALYYFSGAAALVVGLAIVQFHNIWVADWPVVITILGWMSALKGAVRLMAPQKAVELARSFAKSDRSLTIVVVFLVILGAWLTSLGYLI